MEGAIPVVYVNSKSSVNLLYFSVHSLLPKIDHLRVICSLFSPDIVCIVESWLDDTISDFELSVQGYSIVRLDRSRHGGGVLIYVQDLFTCSPLFKGTPDLECLIVAVNSSAGPSPVFTVAPFYRPLKFYPCYFGYIVSCFV